MPLSLANLFRSIARLGIIILGVSMISISIFTGALKYGITIANILRNLPEALPWFLLLFTLLLAWEYELIGGILLLLLGLGGIFYMQSSNHASLPQTSIMLAVIVFAFLFILSWLIRRLYYLKLE
jgi:succinate dehydrogenase/fumarate reductase cytochrome b subunit